MEDGPSGNRGRHRLGDLQPPGEAQCDDPTLNREMRDVLETLELDDEARVLVLTGAGESWTAGMDLPIPPSG